MSPNSKPASRPSKISKMFHPFEKRLLTCLVKNQLRSKHFLVAVSGGQDSMALIYALSAIAENLRLKLTVAHIHHGACTDSNQLRFRDESLRLVKQYCDSIGVDFVGAVGASDDLVTDSSEAFLRSIRYHLLNGLSERVKADFILTAHHRDDVLETRVIRLLRGVGPSGLKAISFRRGKLLRPLLGFWRREIEDYNRASGIKSLEDPSNKDTKYFRNWIRHYWLKELKDRSPAYYINLSQSLLLLATQAKGLEKSMDSIIVEGQLDRLLFTELSPDRKLSVLVHYVRQIGSYDYRASQIREIRKRLDTSRNDITFRVGQLDWTVTPARIRASRGSR